MTEQPERMWARNHQISGSIVGRFTGEYAGVQQELVALQTWDGITVVPAAALIPVDRAYMIRQAALDLERVIQGMVEAGFSLDDAQSAWARALGQLRAAAPHEP